MFDALSRARRNVGSVAALSSRRPARLPDLPLSESFTGALRLDRPSAGTAEQESTQSRTGESISKSFHPISPYLPFVLLSTTLFIFSNKMVKFMEIMSGYKLKRQKIFFLTLLVKVTRLNEKAPKLLENWTS